MVQKNSYIKLTSLLLFIFFFSGFAALMYQVAWQRLLTVHYGVGAISITLIVSVYMFGLGIGALFGGFLAERIKNKIVLYFTVELLIGCFGLISLSFLDFLGQYTAGSSYLLSFFYMFLFLSLPTFLMGITLPLLTKMFNNLIHNFLNTVSILYFINTLGAAIGSVFASYVVISFFGLDTAIYFAAIINFILAALIFLAKYYPEIQPEQEKEHVPVLPDDKGAIFGRLAYFLVFITGFLAIGYEIAWLRVIGILVKASPYAFSSVLSIYLLGIAVGSFAMGRYLERHKTENKKNIFFLIQFFIGIFVIVIFAGYYYLTKYTYLEVFTSLSFSRLLHPHFIIPSFGSIESFLKDIYSIFDVFLWPIIFMFIPTILMGASFPLISLLALTQRDKEGGTIGTVYFFNISGNVLGGIVTGFLLLPYLGTEITLLSFSLVGIFFGLFVSRLADNKLQIIRRIVIVSILLVVSITLFPERGQLYPIMHIPPGKEFKKYFKERYFEEGIDGTIMTYKHNEKVRNYINGRQHARRPLPIYSYETLETVSFARSTENVLIIGYGTGTITEDILRVDSVQKVTLVELNNTLIKNLSKISLFKEMLADERVDLIIDDGRRFLLRTDDKFDLILIDPLSTTTSYSNNLYSLQFFELVNNHLNTGGIFMVWKDEHRVLPNTVMSAFSHYRIYNSFCLASNSDFIRNEEQQKLLFNSFSPRTQRGVLRLASRESKHVGDRDYIKNLVANYPINQDWKPVTEYYIGLKVKEKIKYYSE